MQIIFTISEFTEKFYVFLVNYSAENNQKCLKKMFEGNYMYEKPCCFRGGFSHC